MSAAPRTLRVLHLASFAGNIGDLANHAGSRLMFARHLDFDLSYTELEIREFYWKQRAFDDAFVHYANSFDLLLIGGGNYFELWVQNSATGTSIDIAPDKFAMLTVPTAFYALGVDTGQGYTDQTASRFRAFVTSIMSRKTMFVCVRNDGSSLALHEVLGQEMARQIPVMPDGGFFAASQTRVTDAPIPHRHRIGVNIAGDMLDQRFHGADSHHGFLAGLAKTFTKLLDTHEDLEIELVPHIWRDVVLISELLPLIQDQYMRRRVSIAPLMPVHSGLNDFLQRYGRYDLVLGMRFHANVCPIGMGVPTLGLLNYPQVALLYKELGIEDRLLDVRPPDFALALRDIVLRDLVILREIKVRYRTVVDQVHRQATDVLKELNAWLHARFDG